MGLALQEVPINAKIRTHYNLSNKKGLFVTRIETESPASRSQLQEGDIIISFNGKPVNSTHELFKELTHRSILSMVDISVIRHTEWLNFSITPMERKAS
jgi:S1-C subfamily serine protease